MALAASLSAILHQRSIADGVSATLDPGALDTARDVNAMCFANPRGFNLGGGYSSGIPSSGSVEGIYGPGRVTCLRARIDPADSAFVMHSTGGKSTPEKTALVLHHAPSPPASNISLYTVGAAGSIVSRELDHRDTQNQKEFQEAYSAFSTLVSTVYKDAKGISIRLGALTFTYQDSTGTHFKTLDDLIKEATSKSISLNGKAITEAMVLEPIKKLRHIAEISGGVTLAWPTQLGSKLRGPNHGDPTFPENTPFISQHGRPSSFASAPNAMLNLVAAAKKTTPKPTDDQIVARFIESATFLTEFRKKLNERLTSSKDPNEQAKIKKMLDDLSRINLDSYLWACVVGENGDKFENAKIIREARKEEALERAKLENEHIREWCKANPHADFFKNYPDADKIPDYCAEEGFLLLDTQSDYAKGCYDLDKMQKKGNVTAFAVHAMIRNGTVTDDDCAAFGIDADIAIQVKAAAVAANTAAKAQKSNCTTKLVTAPYSGLVTAKDKIVKLVSDPAFKEALHDGVDDTVRKVSGIWNSIKAFFQS